MSTERISDQDTMQRTPELGEFRGHAALERMGVHSGPRTVGKIFAVDREAERPK